MNQLSAISFQPSARLKAWLLCFLSAILLILSFPATDFWVLAWLGFVPLFFALQNQSKIRAFLLGYLTGIVFWSGIIYWLVHVTQPGTIILILYLALYFGIFALTVRNYQLRVTRYELLFIPSVWILLEYIRGHLFTGFPWALLGYSQYKNLPIIQIADITGVWGVSFLVMMVNVVVYSVIGYRCSVLATTRKYIAPFLCVFLALAYGYYKIYRAPSTEHRRTPITISVIQGNIPQELKWQSSAQHYILSKYVELTDEAAADKPDLIIWPEAASPGLLGEDGWIFNEIFSLAESTKIPLLLGTVTYDGGKYFNSAVLIDAFGNIEERYDKLHLVPFGEYIPLKKFLPFLEAVVPIGDINRGHEYTIFSSENRAARTENRFAVLICFEDLFPELSRGFVKRGAQFLVNITNDAWYKQTSAPYQHLQASVFRSVENRIYLVRCANTGVSAFIAPSGRILSGVRDKEGRDIFIEGYATKNLSVTEAGESFYTRLGDFLVAFCFLFVIYGIMHNLKK